MKLCEDGVFCAGTPQRSISRPKEQLPTILSSVHCMGAHGGNPPEKPLPSGVMSAKALTSCQAQPGAQTQKDIMEQVLELDSLETEPAIARIQSLLQDIDSTTAGLTLVRRVLESKLRAANQKVLCSSSSEIGSRTEGQHAALCASAPLHHSTPLNLSRASAAWEDQVEARRNSGGFTVCFDTENVMTHEIPSRQCRIYKITQAQLSSELSRLGPGNSDDESSSEDDEPSDHESDEECAATIAAKNQRYVLLHEG